MVNHDPTFARESELIFKNPKQPENIRFRAVTTFLKAQKTPFPSCNEDLALRLILRGHLGEKWIITHDKPNEAILANV